MCDGVTQGEAGMELSLFSRDVIALATGVALSHQMFDAALYLGVCDKIVPGLVIGALAFGHLPALFVPAGPMTSGLPNDEKSRIRQLFAEGKVGRDALLEAESQSYHGPGTCTFYGTANTNQMLMEIMGLHIPGSSFVNPNTPLRDALTTRRHEAGAGDHRARQCLHADGAGAGREGVRERHRRPQRHRRLHQPHDPSHRHGCGRRHRARPGTISPTSRRSTPLLTRVYPNGKADVNHFHAAGGMGFLIRELAQAGLLHRGRHHRLGRRARRLHGGAARSRPTAR